jgi:hypothetical protein
VTTTAILAFIGVITLVLTAATRIPSALTDFLRACTGTVKAARELGNTLRGRPAGGRSTSRAVDE